MPDITMGIVDVARLAATAATVAIATITSTLSATKFRRERGKQLRPVTREPVFADQVSALDPTQLAQSVDKRRALARPEQGGFRKWHEHAHPVDLPALLTTRGTRNGEHCRRGCANERSPVNH
jgi:hypothetical protein